MAISKGKDNKMYDLRGSNNRINSKVRAYRLTPMGRVPLLDEYDVYSALVLGYDILIFDLTEQEVS